MRTDVPQVPTTPSYFEDRCPAGTHHTLVCDLAGRGQPEGSSVGTHGDSWGLMWPDSSGGHDRAGSAGEGEQPVEQDALDCRRSGRSRGEVYTQSCGSILPGEGRRDNKTTRAEMHRPALVPRTAVCARPGGPAAAQTPSPGGGPGLATDWGLLSEKLELGKKGLLPGPRHAHCAKTESLSRSPKPTVNQGIIIPFTREFAAFIGQASPPPAAHQISTKEGSGTRVTLANARPCCFSVPPKEDAQPSRLLHTSQVCRLQTDPLHEPLDPKTSCGINLCTVYKADVPSGCKHNAKFHTAFQKNENSERTCC